MNTPAIPDQAERSLATDPRHSVIVQAPAGAGKTTLLVQRYLRLLTQVSRPEEILAITFTKKAAAEMRHRVLDMLASPDPLAARVLARDRQLGWSLLSNTHSIKIQTIDSLAMELARQTSTSHSLHGTSVVEDAQSCYEQATQRLLQRVHSADATAALVADFLAFLNNDAALLTRIACAMLAKRDQWLHLTQAVTGGSDSVAIEQILRTTLVQIQQQAELDFQQQLSAEDFSTLLELREIQGHDHWTDTVAGLLTKQHTLRKRMPKEALPDSGLRKTYNAWLQELHACGMAPAFEALASTPDAFDPAYDLSVLTLCSANLSLAALELAQVFVEQRTCDFTELLIAAKRALRGADEAPTDLALLLDYRVQHMLVDEFQDTSRSQMEFFTLLTETWTPDDGRSFFAVGDPMQSIYRFREADVGIFIEATERGLGQLPLTRCQLSANFRSAPELVTQVNQLFAALMPGSTNAQRGDISYSSAVAMQPANPAAQIQCLQFNDPLRETTACAAHIEQLLAAEPDSTIAVLCQSRKHLQPLLDTLARRKIAWQATDMDALQNKQIVLDLFSLMQLLTEPDNRIAWAAMLRTPMIGLPLAQLQSLADQDFSLNDAHDNPRVQRLARALEWGLKHLHERPVSEVLQGCFARCGGLSAYSADELQHANSLFDLLDAAGYPMPDLGEFARQLQNLFAQSTAGARVQVLTIHKAKGLEYDHVLLPYLNSSTRNDDTPLLRWQSTPFGLVLGARDDPVHQWLGQLEKQRARNERLRLLYVACTRARTGLYLSFTQTGRQPAGLAKYLAAIAVEADDDASSAANLTPPATPDLSQPANLRLPASFVWQPPPELPAGQRQTNDLTGQLIQPNDAVEVGILVHRALAWAAGKPLPLPIDLLQAKLHQWQRLDGFVAHDLADRALAQVQHLAASTLGRWVLAAHPQHETEVPLTAFIDGEFSHVVLDRMFVEDGVRWVIDYKTSGDASHADQLTRHRQRHAAQIQRYVRIVRNLFPEPVKAALLLTDVPRLIDMPG